MDRRDFLQTVTAIGMGAVVPAPVLLLAGPSDGVKATRQIVVDAETTGLSAECGDRIIEIGCVELLGRKLTGNNKHFYLNPGRDKPRFEMVADELLEYLRDAEIIIHNAPFDVSFLNKELELAGRPPLEQFVGSVIDTLVMAKEMFPGERNSLNALCDRLGVDNSTRTLHGALPLAELQADVYIELTRDWGPAAKHLTSPTRPGAMRLELQAELLRRYPKFFRKPGMRLVDRGIGSDGDGRMQDDTAAFDERGVECGDGWFALIDRVCRACESEIEMLASQGVPQESWPRVAQIKEKFGNLCVYTKGQIFGELNEEICRDRRYVSRRTCEQCGAFKKPWQIGSWRTLCNRCEAESAGAGESDYQTLLLEHAQVLEMLASRAA